MKHLLSIALASTCILFAQTPNLSGVWKMNPEKSKMTGPAPSGYVMWIEQSDTQLKETIGVTTPRGEQRSKFTFNLGEKPSMNSSRGMPMRTVASTEGATLVLTSKIASTKPAAQVEKYTLSSDGNVLTIENGQQTMVLEKQPDSAAEAFRKPEQTAAEHFKNVQVLKDVPESEFIDTMRYWTMALGVECGHCHVQGKFEADDKPAKLMARKMVTMTRNINETTFAGRNEVKCYTCHKGQADPASRPAF